MILILLIITLLNLHTSDTCVLVTDLDGTLVESNLNTKLLWKGLLYSRCSFREYAWASITYAFTFGYRRQEIYECNKKYIDRLNLDEEKFNLGVIEKLKKHKGEIILSTAADGYIAIHVADYMERKFNIKFNYVFYSDAKFFNSGRNKLKKIKQKIGDDTKFIYIGDSVRKDCKVWIDTNASMVIVGDLSDAIKATKITGKDTYEIIREDFFYTEEINSRLLP